MPVDVNQLPEKKQGPHLVDVNSLIKKKQAAPTLVNANDLIKPKKKDTGADSGSVLAAAGVPLNQPSPSTLPSASPSPVVTGGPFDINTYVKPTIQNLDPQERKIMDAQLPALTSPERVDNLVKGIIDQRQYPAARLTNAQSFIADDMAKSTHLYADVPFPEKYKQQVLEGDGSDSNISVTRYYKQRNSEIDDQLKSLKDQQYVPAAGGMETAKASNYDDLQGKIDELARYKTTLNKYTDILNTYHAAKQIPPPTEKTVDANREYNRQIGLQVSETNNPLLAENKRKNIASSADAGRHPEIVDRENYQLESAGLEARRFALEADHNLGRIPDADYTAQKNDIIEQRNNLFNLHPAAKRVAQAQALGQIIQEARSLKNTVQSAGAPLNVVSLWQNIVNYGISEDEIKAAAKDPRLQGMTEDEIKYQINNKDDIPGTSFGGNVYNKFVVQSGEKLLAPIGSLLTKGRLRTDAEVEAERYAKNQVFQFNAAQSPDQPETIINTDKKSADYLQQVANPDAGHHNTGYGTLNALGDGVGLLGQMWLVSELTGQLGDAAFGASLGAETVGIGTGFKQATALTAGQKTLFGNFTGLTLTGYNDGYEASKNFIGEQQGGEAARKVYATMYGMVPGLLFGALGSPAKLFENIVAGNASKEVAQSIFSNIPKNGIEGMGEKEVKSFFEKTLAARITKSTLEENTKATLMMGVNQLANAGVQAMFNPQSVDTKNLGHELLNEGVKNFLTFAPISFLGAGMAALRAPHADQSNLEQEALYRMGKDPLQYSDYVNEQVADGKMTQEDANKRIQLVNTMAAVQAEVPQDLSRSEKIKFANNLLYEKKYLDEIKLLSSKPLIDRKEAQIKDVQQAQEEILKNSTGIEKDADGKPIIITPQSIQNEKAIQDRAAQAKAAAADQTAKIPDSADNNAAPETAATVIRKAIDNKEIKGGFAMAAEHALKSKDSQDEFLQEVAAQALNKVTGDASTPEDSMKAAVRSFGQDLVDLAVSKFPVENPAPGVTLTPDAEHLLKSLGEGSMPTFITKNLERIANDNGIKVTETSTANDIVNQLKTIQDENKTAQTGGGQIQAANDQSGNAQTQSDTQGNRIAQGNAPVVSYKSGTEASNTPPPDVPGRTHVTLSGLTEPERQTQIAIRKKETATSENVKRSNDLISQAKKYAEMGRARFSSEGLQLLNKINLAAADLGYTFKDGVIKSKNGREIKPDTSDVGDRSIDEKGVPLLDREPKTQAVFKQMLDGNVFQNGYRISDGNRMDAAALDATIEDIINGIPSERANRYLDQLDASAQADNFDVGEKGNPGYSMDQLLGTVKDVQSVPLTEEHLDKWLADEAQLTPEDEQVLLDNFDNLYTEYEQERPPAGDKSEVKITSTAPKTSDIKAAEPNKADTGAKPAEPASSAGSRAGGDPSPTGPIGERGGAGAPTPAPPEGGGGEAQPPTEITVPPTPDPFPSGTEIRKSGILANYGKRFDFAEKTDQSVADQSFAELTYRAKANGISVEQEAANHVLNLSQQIKGIDFKSSKYDIITAALHLNDIDRQIEKESKQEFNLPVVGKLIEDRTEALKVLRELGNKTGGSLRLFNLVYDRAESDGRILVKVTEIKRDLGISEVPLTIDALNKSGLSPTDKYKVRPFVEAIEAETKRRVEIEAAAKSAIDLENNKEVQDYIKAQVEQKAAETKSTTPKEKRKKSDQLKDLAAKIRQQSEFDKFNKGYRGDIEKMGGLNVDWQELYAQTIDYIAAGLAKGEDLAKLIVEGVDKIKGKVEPVQFTKDIKGIIARAGLPDKDAVLKNIGDIAAEQKATAITADMVNKGYINDVVNDHIHSDLPADQVIKAATEELKTLLPDVTEKQVTDAVLKKGEFKLEKKENLKKEFTDKKIEIRRISDKTDRLETLEAAEGIHAIQYDDGLTAKEKKAAIEQKKSEFEKSLDAKIKELNKQRSAAANEKKSMLTLDEKIRQVRLERKFLDEAIKNPPKANEQITALREELKKAYRDAGIRPESGNKEEIAIAQEADTAIKEIEGSDLPDEVKAEHIKEIKQNRDQQLQNTKQGVLTLFRDHLNEYVKELNIKQDAAENAGDAKTVESLKELKRDILDLGDRLKPNVENLRDQINKADQDFNAIINGKNALPYKKELQNISDGYRSTWQKTSDQLQRQQLLDKAVADGNEIQRKLNGGQYTEIPVTKYDISRDQILANQQAENLKAGKKLNMLTHKAHQESESNISRAISLRRQYLIASFGAIEKVAGSAVTKPFLDPLLKQTWGRLSALITGIKPTELGRVGDTFRQLKNEGSANDFMRTRNQKYVDAIVNYEKTKSANGETDPKTAVARKALLKAELDHTSSLAYLFISPNSGYDIAQVMVNAATDFDAANGKYPQSTRAERAAINQASSSFKKFVAESGYWMESINRTHAALKSFSARQALMDGYIENLQYLQAQEGHISNENRIKAWDMATLAEYEQGRFGEKTLLSDFIGRLKADDKPAWIRNATNFLLPVAKIAINITKQGIDRAFPVEAFVRTLGTDAMKGIELNAEDGKQYSNFIQQYGSGIKRGFDSLPLEQKKYVNTLLMKGMAGMAQYALMGYFLSKGWVNYGGAYNDNDPFHKKYGRVLGSDGKELKYGEWEFFGHRTGKYVNLLINHSPYALPTSLAADYVNQQKRESKTGDQGYKGISSVINEVVQRLPFAGAADLTKGVIGADEYKMQKLISGAVPGFKNVAEFFDKDKNGEPRPVSVSGKGFWGPVWNNIKKDIPGLRNTLPGKVDKSKKKGFSILD